MTRYSPRELQASLGAGLLSFPVTHTTRELDFDEGGFRTHVSWLSSFGPAGLFAAGGTGEFFALTIDEVSAVQKAAASEVDGELPVIGSVGYGTALARQMAGRAQDDGVDGLLLMPPYLTEVPEAGLQRHVALICESTSLPIIAYHRSNARFSPSIVRHLMANHPNFIGVKDGVGDVGLMTALHAEHGSDLLLVGGLPTAEMHALPYQELGVSTYSSAIFNFAPVWATAFYTAIKQRDRETVYEQLRTFLLPFIEIRDRQVGSAVSIVKAGLRTLGRDAGPVRPPLTDFDGPDYDDLAALVAAALPPQK